SATSRLPILKEPLKVHPANPRYFSWNGRALAVVSSGEHYGAVVNLDFDYLKYLDTLQREGMHYTRIFTGAYIEPVGAFGIERNTLAPASERFIAPWKRSGTPGYAGGGNKFDIDQWDEAYLQRLKSFVQAAHERNIIVEVTLFCSTYTDKQWQLSPLHPQNSVDALEFMDWKKLHTEEVPPAIFQQQEKLVRYLVRELNTYPNIIWEIQNEPWSDNHSLGEMINPYLLEKKTFPNRVQITAPSSVSWQRRVARLIRDTEKTLPYQHIIAQNVANFRLAVDPTVDLADVDLVHFHYAYPEACQWNASLAKPICCDETGFAGSGDDAYRQQAWKFMLAGGGLWNHLDYSFSCGKEDGTDVQPKSPGGGSPQLRKELDVLSRFLNSFDLKNMKPDTSLLQNTNGVVGYCLAHPGHSYACYLTQRLPSSLLLNLPAGNYQIEWIEPRTGQSIARFKIQFPREVPIDVPKSRGDLALTIRRVP
ncbi:MAG TPA: hypothetical protein PKD72_13475, partial [Gemmatales bacterium]|nr:hypothetical protein [Gemmatales bacterium]